MEMRKVLKQMKNNFKLDFDVSLFQNDSLSELEISVLFVSLSSDELTGK